VSHLDAAGPGDGEAGMAAAINSKVQQATKNNQKKKRRGGRRGDHHH